MEVPYRRFDVTFRRTKKYYYADIRDVDGAFSDGQRVVIVRRDRVEKIASLQSMCLNIDPKLVSAYMCKIVRVGELIELVKEACRLMMGSVRLVGPGRVRVTAPLSLGAEEQVEALVFPTWDDYTKFVEELALGVWCHVLESATKLVDILARTRVHTHTSEKLGKS